ncbi:MAG: hypothetical protein WD708_04615 [Kiritimatiellia bacterium]
MINSFTIPRFICFLVFLCVFCLTGCRHSPDSEVDMPPPPPPHKIQSELFPPESNPATAPAPSPGPSASEGITLRLEDRQVNLENLEPASSPGEQTVVIRVDPATPYNEVVTIMEQIHDLGYLIHFQSEK